MRERYSPLQALKLARTWIVQTSLDGGRPDGMNAISRNRPQGFDVGHLNDAIAHAETLQGSTTAKRQGSLRLPGCRTLRWYVWHIESGAELTVTITRDR